MADRIVIYDPALEVAALLDMDEGRAIGPVGVGPNAREELSQFVGLMPEAVYQLSSYDLRNAYMQFWQENFAGLYEQAKPSDNGPVVALDGSSDYDARSAEHEASAAGAEPPPPAPADTDMDANAGEAPYVGVCFACQGQGSVPGMEAGSKVMCNLCKGTGKLPAEQPVT